MDIDDGKAEAQENVVDAQRNVEWTAEDSTSTKIRLTGLRTVFRLFDGPKDGAQDAEVEGDAPGNEQSPFPSIAVDEEAQQRWKDEAAYSSSAGGQSKRERQVAAPVE